MGLIKNIKKLNADVKGLPLPTYPLMEPDAIPKASILLYYNVNSLTEMIGLKLYDHKYCLPAAHAAIYTESGLIHNVGKFRLPKELKSTFRSTRRVDVIVCKDMDDETRDLIIRDCTMDISRPKIGFRLPDYAVLDYLRFGWRIWKPTKADFCSENCVEIFHKRWAYISDLEPYNTAPWDLQEYAELNPTTRPMYTVHVGKDFKLPQKYLKKT